MPTFEFTSPDGKTYEISGPEGATQEQAFAILQQQLASGEKTRPPSYKLGDGKLPDLIPGVPPQPPRSTEPSYRSIPEELARQLGLTARAAVSGATAIPGMIADVPVRLANLAGANLPLPSEAQQQLMTRAGLPVPQTPVERIAQAGAQGIAGGAAGIGLGAGLQGMASPAAQAVGQAMQARPAAQLVSGATGGMAGQGAAEMGAGPVGQTAAALAGGAVPFAFGRTPIQTPDALKADTLKRAKEHGFKVVPSEVAPTTVNEMLESPIAKTKLAQKISVDNQELRNVAVRKELGIPENTPISSDVLDNIRNEAYDKYKDVIKADYGTQPKVERISASLGVKGGPSFPEKPSGIISTPEFKAKIASMEAEADRLHNLAPGTFNVKQIKSTLSDFKRNEWSPDDALNLVKEIRNQASANLKNPENYEKTSLGRSQYAIAQAMEDLIEKNLARTGNKDLMDKFREARQIIAKTYDVQYALNPATGDISAAKLATISKKKPLSGALKDISDFYKMSPKSNMDVAKIGGQPTYSAWDFLVAGGAAAAGHPGVAVAELASRGTIPKILSSDWYQRRFANIPQGSQWAGTGGMAPAAANIIGQGGLR